MITARPYGIEEVEAALAADKLRLHQLYWLKRSEQGKFLLYVPIPHAKPST